MIDENYIAFEVNGDDWDQLSYKTTEETATKIARNFSGINPNLKHYVLQVIKCTDSVSKDNVPGGTK